jgi:hypothetical protein
MGPCPVTPAPSALTSAQCFPSVPNDPPVRRNPADRTVRSLTSCIRPSPSDAPSAAAPPPHAPIPAHAQPRLPRILPLGMGSFLRFRSPGRPSRSSASIGVHPRRNPLLPLGMGCFLRFPPGPRRAARRPAPRPGLVQRTLLAGTALGLAVHCPTAGHGVLPPSRSPLLPARSRSGFASAKAGRRAKEGRSIFDHA